MIVVNGLKSCYTCRKTRAWLAAEGLEHRFRDLRAEALEAAEALAWLKAVGPDRLVNRRGTTWRGLAEAERAVAGEAATAALLVAHPALVKRPVFEIGGGVLVGFDDAARAALKSA